MYLTFACDKSADYWSSLCSWHTSGEKIRNTFGRQALAMVWDYAETNPFSTSTGNWMACVDWVWKVVDRLPAIGYGQVQQYDATSIINGTENPIISTDPPYYDNIDYSDLSDFFYIWLRHALSDEFPSIFATLLTPKNQELIASPFRHGGNNQKAKAFFEKGLGEAFVRMRNVQIQDILSQYIMRLNKRKNTKVVIMTRHYRQRVGKLCSLG